MWIYSNGRRRESQNTQFVFNNIFFDYLAFLRSCSKIEQAIDDTVARAQFVAAKTHSEYVIYLAFNSSWGRLKRRNVKFYFHCLWCLLIWQYDGEMCEVPIYVTGFQNYHVGFHLLWFMLHFMIFVLSLFTATPILNIFYITSRWQIVILGYL
jgi:hypothetical protein